MKNNFSKLAREWIKRVKDDLLFTKAGFEEGFYNQICFFSHQTVEKYLKAYLIISKGNIKKKEKIHDLPKLAKFC
jgi:HEPN domain-containing protein